MSDSQTYASFTPDGGAMLIMPFEENQRDTGGRDHIHVFPHSPGGLPEKLGAELKVVTIRAIFDPAFEGLYPSNFAYPDTLDALEDLSESQITGILVVPNLRTPIRAYLRKCSRTQVATVTSGERAVLTFMQDQTVSEKNAQTQVASQSNNLAADVTTFAAMASSVNSPLVGQLQTVSTTYYGMTSFAQGSSGGLLLVGQMISLCSQLSELQDFTLAINWPIVDALHDVWLDAILLSQGSTTQGVTLGVYVVPMQMTTAQISQAIYGDPTHADDIYDSNQIDDALSVPATTRIVYDTTGAVI